MNEMTAWYLGYREKTAFDWPWQKEWYERPEIMVPALGGLAAGGVYGLGKLLGGQAPTGDHPRFTEISNQLTDDVTPEEYEWAVNYMRGMRDVPPPEKTAASKWQKVLKSLPSEKQLPMLRKLKEFSGAADDTVPALREAMGADLPWEHGGLYDQLAKHHIARGRYGHTPIGWSDQPQDFFLKMLPESMVPPAMMARRFPGQYGIDARVVGMGHPIAKEEGVGRVLSHELSEAKSMRDALHGAREEELRFLRAAADPDISEEALARMPRGKSETQALKDVQVGRARGAMAGHYTASPLLAERMGRHGNVSRVPMLEEASRSTGSRLRSMLPSAIDELIPNSPAALARQTELEKGITKKLREYGNVGGHTMPVYGKGADKLTEALRGLAQE